MARSVDAAIRVMLPVMSHIRSDWSPDPRLAALLASQSGLFTAEQARDCGVTTGEIQRLRSAGVLESVRRGVYAFRTSYRALEDLGRHAVDVRALTLRCDEPTTISHESAAVVQELPLLRPDLSVVHATRPELQASRLEAGAHHHPGALPTSHVATCTGIKVTAPQRTAIDVARTNDFARGLAAVDSALRSGVTPEQLRAVLEFCRSWPGARGASRAVSYGDGRAANPGESWSRALLIEHGLEPTDLQLEVRDRRGLVGIADVAWAGQQTLGEFDGRGKYGLEPGGLTQDAAQVLWREKLREDRLRRLGWEIVRWTWADLFHPQALAQRVRAAFERAQQRSHMGLSRG
jgi:predicted transcriptional regulator of viral defense system